MSQFRTLADLALHVDELLLRPENMATARELAEACLTDPKQGHVDALQFPTDSGNPYDWTPGSLACESGEEESPVLTPGQISLILAALHAVYCPVVEKVIAFPDTELQPIDDGKVLVPSGFYHAVRWVVIRDRVRKLGDYALPWFTMLLRRFERNLSEQTPQPGTQSGAARTALPAPADVGSGNEMKPDGPEAGCHVWSGGRSVEVRGRIYAVVAFMWERDSAPFGTLKSAVNSEVDDDTIHTWVNRANNALDGLNLPWKLAADGVNRVVRKEPR